MKTKQTPRIMAMADVRAEFGLVLNEVKYRNQTVVVTRHGKPVARIVPIEERKA